MIRTDGIPYGVLDIRYYTKDEVNDIVEGASFDFFLNNTNSDISSPTQYFVMDPTETGEAESSFSDTVTGDAFLIDTFATSTSEPTFTELIIGIYSLHIHAETTVGANIKTVRLYYELYKRTHPGGIETLLITSEESDVLTDTKLAVEVHGTLSSDTILDSTDRFVVKIYANIEDDAPPRNTNPLVTLYAEGNLASRFEVKTTIAAFDDRYVQVTGDRMTGDLLMGFGDLVSEQNPDGADAIRIKGTDYIDIVIGGMTGLFAVWNVADDTPVFFVDERGDTDITGDAHIDGDAFIDGKATITGLPTSTAYGGASLIVNPATATADYLLQSWSVANSLKASIDEDGDITTVGDLITTKELDCFSFGNNSDEAIRWYSGAARNRLIGERYFSGGGGASIYGKHARGTLASPEYLDDTNVLIQFTGFAWNENTNDWQNSMRLDFIADGNHSVGNMPTSFQFIATPSGSITPATIGYFRGSGDFEITRGNLIVKGNADIGDDVSRGLLTMHGEKPDIGVSERGGSINWVHDATGTATGFTYANSDNQFVWDTSLQSASISRGNAYVDFDTGDIHSNGTITIDADVRTNSTMMWAEDSGDMASGLTFSFGNGDTLGQGPRQVSSGKIHAMSMQHNVSADATVRVRIAINGTADSELECATTGAANGGSTDTSTAGVSFAAGDRITFRVTTVPTGVTNGTVMACWIVYD